MAGSAIQLQQRVDDIVRMYEEGQSLSDVSAAIGFSRSVILYHLRKRGVQSRPSVYKPAYDHERSTEMARLYAEGVPTGKIAAQFKVSKPTVRLHAEKHGVELRPWGIGRLSSEQVDEVVEMFQRGESLNAIGRHLKTSRDTLLRNLDKRGIPRRQRARRPAQPPKPAKPKKIDNAERKMQLIDRMMRLRKTLDALGKAA